MLPIKEFQKLRRYLPYPIVEQYDKWNQYVYDQVIKYTDIVHKSEEFVDGKKSRKYRMALCMMNCYYSIANGDIELLDKWTRRFIRAAIKTNKDMFGTIIDEVAQRGFDRGVGKSKEYFSNHKWYITSICKIVELQPNV